MSYNGENLDRDTEQRIWGLAMVDVTVMGAGIFGLSVAWACLQKGASVRVIDPNGVGAGASGGLVGALAPHTPERWNAKKAFQFESLILAERFWAEIENVSGCASGYGRTGRLQPIADERTLLLAQERAEHSKDLWEGKATWQVVERTQFSDWSPESPTGLLIHDTLSARLHLRFGCFALAQAIRALGGEIVQDGVYSGQIVWATGAQGLQELSEQLAAPVGNAVKGQAMLLGFSAPEAPQLFADALHIIPHANGTTAIGSTSERDYASATETDTLLDDVYERAMAAFPVLRDAPILERWAGLRPRAKSRAPMLGAWPGRDGHFIANGGFKIGFGMAPKIGHVMADLVLDQHNAIPEGFRVEDCL